MRPSCSPALCLFGVVGFLGTVAAQERLPAPEPTALGRLSITLENGRLTAMIKECPLGVALEELGARTRVSVITADAVGHDAVSAELRNVTIEGGFRRLLEGYDTFFYYGGASEKDGPVTLRAVWVYPKGGAAGLRPVAPEVWASAKELEASLADADLGVRERAYEALMGRPDRRSRDLVLQAIRGASENDEGMRQRILYAAFAKGLELPTDILSELVYADRSEQMRWMALDALSQHTNVKGVAAAALNDTSPVVRERAKQILADLEANRVRRGSSQ